MTTSPDDLLQTLTSSLPALLSSALLSPSPSTSSNSDDPSQPNSKEDLRQGLRTLRDTTPRASPAHAHQTLLALAPPLLRFLSIAVTQGYGREEWQRGGVGIVGLQVLANLVSRSSLPPPSPSSPSSLPPSSPPSGVRAETDEIDCSERIESVLGLVRPKEAQTHPSLLDILHPILCPPSDQPNPPQPDGPQADPPQADGGMEGGRRRRIVALVLLYQTFIRHPRAFDHLSTPGAKEGEGEGERSKLWQGIVLGLSWDVQYTEGSTAEEEHEQQEERKLRTAILNAWFARPATQRIGLERILGSSLAGRLLVLDALAGYLQSIVDHSRDSLVVDGFIVLHARLVDRLPPLIAYLSTAPPPAAPGHSLDEAAEELKRVMRCASLVLLGHTTEQNTRPAIRLEQEMKRVDGDLLWYLVRFLRAADRAIPPLRVVFAPDPSRARMSVEQARIEAGTDVWAAFGTLKREAVRLLGLLAMRDPVTQDRIRDLGGLEAVLSLTKLDEREPFIREYALLAVRYLVENNAESQSRLASYTQQPIGVVGEHGQVQMLPPETESGS